MPDENKFKKLREVGYTIPNLCGLCKHAKWGGGDWGECAVHEYEHLKHSGSPRGISIHKFGSCEEFEENDLHVSILGNHREFREE